MLTRIYRTALLALGVLLVSSPVFSQTGSLAGKIIGEDGNPLQGALVKIERTDIKGNYKVKSNKKGEYFHAGTATDLKKVYQTLNSRLSLEKKETEVTALLSGIAALFAMASGLLSLLWFNRIL